MSSSSFSKSSKRARNRGDNIKAIAQHKAKKLAKEDERKRELMKQYPKLFSPSKTKITEKKRNDLLSPTLRRELGIENVFENAENKHHNIIVNSPSELSKRLEDLDGSPPEDSDNFHCIFDFESCSPSPNKKPNGGRKQSSIGSRRESSFCRCGRPSTNRRSSVMSTISTDTFENDDEEDCDICLSLASRKASRAHLMQTLRHFLREVPPISIVVEEERTPPMSSPSDRPITADLEAIPQTNECVEEAISSANEKSNDVLIESQVKNSSLSSGSSCSGFDTTVDEGNDGSDSNCQGGFHEVLERGLIEGRVGAKVYGSQIKGNHVEYLVKIQVLSNYENTHPHTQSFEMEMVLWRRYSQFSALYHALLQNKTMVSTIPKFPPKQMFPNMGFRWRDPTFIAKRQIELDTWLSSAIHDLVSNGTDMENVASVFGIFMSNQCQE